MGLIKTMSQSSAELKDILDRLTALESGETFVTKEMFESLKNADNSNNIMLANYPVGSIYLSVDSANPSTKFGGTWVAWGAGRVPVGVNASDLNFNAVEKTGGESKVTLTGSQMPPHLHGFTDGATAIIYDKTELVARGNDFQTFKAPTSGTLGVSGTSNTGGGDSHNNLQPYITCYMWKRTA